MLHPPISLPRYVKSEFNFCAFPQMHYKFRYQAPVLTQKSLLRTKCNHPSFAGHKGANDQILAPCSNSSTKWSMPMTSKATTPTTMMPKRVKTTIDTLLYF